jgi:Tfp pilus assembly protein PilF
VRRDPTDGEAHWMLGAVLQQTGGTAEAARERELGRRLSPNAATWESRASSAEPIPRGLERMKNRLGRAGARVDSVLTASGQRDQASLAAFHLDAGRRAFEREADRTAETELRRALYLSPYLAEAHLLMGRIYLRGRRPQDAVDALKIALWSEETSIAHLTLAEAYVQLQEPALARAEAQRALAMDPTSAAAKQLLDRLKP